LPGSQILGGDCGKDEVSDLLQLLGAAEKTARQGQGMGIVRTENELVLAKHFPNARGEAES
jgi:hypothetical protein